MDPEPPSFLISLAFSLPLLLCVVGMLFFLFASAILSGAEIALFGLAPTNFVTNKKDRPEKQEIIIKLLDRPKRLLATILIANNFSNITFVLLFDYFGNLAFSSLNRTIFGLDLRFILEIIVATFLLMFTTEIVPKILANRKRMAFAEFVARPIYFLDKILVPLSKPMQSTTIWIHRHFGKQGTNLNVDQLSHALELTNTGDTSKEEHKILKGIVSFGNTDTKQVMCPRMDIFALNKDQKYAVIIPEIIKNGYSRIPVYGDDIDHIVGILYVKDLLPHLGKANFSWNKLVRDPYFVPENKKLDDLLNDFKDKKTHLAIVVDEYGGTSGLISLEDIIEEIVGEINDEFDDEDVIFSQLDENNYVFEGKTPLKEFYKALKLENSSDFEDNKGEAETLAGFLLEISQGFPKKDDPIEFKHYTFYVEVIQNKRLKQIKLNIKPETENGVEQ